MKIKKLKKKIAELNAKLNDPKNLALCRKERDHLVEKLAIDSPFLIDGRSNEERAIALVKEFMAGSAEYSRNYPGATIAEQFITRSPDRELIEKADSFLHEIGEAILVVEIVYEVEGVYQLCINGEMDSDEHDTHESAEETREELLAWNRGDR